MIRSLVFHIGDPKNGSSSIQQALQARAWRCEGMTIIPQEELNASALANSINPKRSTPQKYRRSFDAKKRWLQENDGDLGIISAEFFSAVPPKRMQKALREEFPDHAESARIIAYVRPHASRIVSSYAQRVKAGGETGSFKDFLDNRDQRAKLIYAPRFGTWAEVFGERFTLRPFIREEMAGQDVVTDFFATVLGDTPFELVSQPRTNESLTLEELAGMRVLQSVATEQEVPTFLRLSLGGAIGRGLAGQTARSKNRLALHRSGAEMLAGTYRTDAETLDTAFFDGTPMVHALESAVETARPDAQSLEPEDYFSPAALKELRALALQIAKRLTERPHAWRQQYQAGIGQRSDLKQDRAQQKNAKAVWSALDAVYPLLAAGRARG